MQLFLFSSGHNHNKIPTLSFLRFWHGQTLLHKISLRPDANLQLLAICVEAGADVNAVNNFGETPLMFVAKIGSSKMCQYLVERGGKTMVFVFIVQITHLVMMRSK